MPPAALALVLGAAVFHSAWNLVLKSEPRRLEASLLALGAAVLLCAPVLGARAPRAPLPSEDRGRRGDLRGAGGAGVQPLTRSARGVRPATVRTRPGEASHIATADATLQAIAIQNAST